MDVQVIRLHFRGAFHTGRRGVGIEESDHRLSADTLFAALLVQLALRDPSLIDPFVASFPRRTGPHGEQFTPGNAPFLLSSAFPFSGDVLFFPVPALPAPVSMGREKALKRVAYVSDSIFYGLLDGATLADYQAKAISYQGGTVWATRDDRDRMPAALAEGSDLWHAERRPRVAVDRESWRSSIFHHGQVLFSAGCGLWFGVAWRMPEIPVGGQPLSAVFKALLSDLAVFGIGGLRSHGLGALDCNWDPAHVITLPDPTSEGDPLICLSRLHPAPDDMPALDHPLASYRLVQVGGWMRAAGHQDARRRVVGMLEEGSVVAARIAGCLVDVSPKGAPHPSWRYGLVFPAALSQAR